MENEENYSRVLLERFKGGEPEAAELLFQRYWQRLLFLTQKRIYNRLQSKIDPEDVAQDAFADFFEKARAGTIHWQKRGDLWRLLSAIAIHKTLGASQHYSAEKRSVNREQAFTEETDSPIDSLSINHQAIVEINDLIESVLASEKPILRRIAELTLAGFSELEVAKRVRRSPRTVRRLRVVLRERLLASGGCKLSGFDSVSARVPDSNNINDYQLLRLIGQGRYSRVYHAIRVDSGIACCVKILKKQWRDHESAQRAFRRESQVLELLNSKATTRKPVARLLAVGKLRQTDQAYLVMDAWEGIPLNQFLTQAKKPSDLVLLIWRLCKAVSQLHAQQIIHADVKPEHFVVASDRSIRVIDFAFAVHPSLPWDEVSFGTDPFLAPERIGHLEAPPTIEADCYAIGATIKSLLHCYLQVANGAATNSSAIQMLRKVADDLSHTDPTKRSTLQSCLAKLKPLNQASSQ